MDAATKQFKFIKVPTKDGMPRRGRMDKQDRFWFSEYRGNKIGMLDMKTDTIREYERYLRDYPGGYHRRDAERRIYQLRADDRAAWERAARTDRIDAYEAYRSAWPSGDFHDQAARRIDLMYISIGGNDVGFSRIVANAVLADQSNLRRLGGWFGHVHGRVEAERQLKGLDDRYKSLNRAIHSILHIPWSQSDRVILTAYPGMALIGDGSQVCPDGRAGMLWRHDQARTSGERDARHRFGIPMLWRIHRQ